MICARVARGRLTERVIDGGCQVFSGCELILKSFASALCGSREHSRVSDEVNVDVDEIFGRPYSRLIQAPNLFPNPMYGVKHGLLA